MQRPDVHMIKKAMKAKGKFAPSDADISNSLKYPFLYFSYAEHMGLPWMDEKYSPAADEGISPTEWMFPEFVMIYKSRGVESRHEITVLHGLDECRNQEERNIMKQHNADTLVYVWTWDFGEGTHTSQEVNMFVASVFALTKGGSHLGGPCFAHCVWPDKGILSKDIDFTFPDQLKQDNHLHETLCESIGGLLTSVQMMHNWLKECDKHPVSVTPTSRPKPSSLDKKRPWRRATGPSILLLDKMPSQSSGATGTGSGKRPHRRRGHWRTLSHPKYRHHPQYQQKIWVKPAFIGPSEEIFEGNMYRLIDQEHGMTLH